MQTKQSYSKESSTAIDRALDTFCEMMIERIESIRQNWSKPWFTDGGLTMAPKPRRERVQRDECFYAAATLREGGIQNTPLLHVRLCTTAQ